MEKVPPHPNPKYELEQYITPSNLASTLLWTAYLRNEIGREKYVADLGCGTGRLCAGAVILGSDCLCIEIDKESIYLAREFFEENGLNADFLLADVEKLNISREIDTVIQNPPFGVVRKGIDITFLKKALEIADTVYTIHKSNIMTRKLIERLAGEFNRSTEVVTLNYELRPYYPWHKERHHIFMVDLYILKRHPPRSYPF
ncbi:METTL5 family protein [Stygiolobus caldivivus]|uniref:Methyltransferase n=1 Tax=Stygiolobus caldivivus TaxID=2824673 RepID=A0A8D5ZH00_9CREN|nr:METTL5 family protein [Stygiolobus caldivivus]BCU69269.1 methyltransferase [Stygiolobus caldivivus]